MITSKKNKTSILSSTYTNMDSFPYISTPVYNVVTESIMSYSVVGKNTVPNSAVISIDMLVTTNSASLGLGVISSSMYMNSALTLNGATLLGSLPQILSASAASTKDSVGMLKRVLRVQDDVIYYGKYPTSTGTVTPTGDSAYSITYLRSASFDRSIDNYLIYTVSPLTSSSNPITMRYAIVTMY